MRHWYTPLWPILALLGLAACGTNSVTPAETFVGQFMRGSTQAPTTLDEDLFKAAIECPTVRIQPQTEFIRREVEGASGDDGLRWQASITETARECRTEGEGTAIRVGISGRVIEGRRGAPDKVELPVRIAVREGGEITYTRLHAVEVALDAPSKSWAFVDEKVFVKDANNADIVVGFDS